MIAASAAPPLFLLSADTPAAETIVLPPAIHSAPATQTTPALQIQTGHMATVDELSVQDESKRIDRWLQPSFLLPNAPRHVWAFGENTTLSLTGLVRGYYDGDQRIRWSGVEQTGVGEAILHPVIETTACDWKFRAVGTFFLNIDTTQNRLGDPARQVYAPNFEQKTFDVFELNVQAQYGDWSFMIGKRSTPMGNLLMPLFTNTLRDAPFLRTEVYQFAETGVFARYAPGSLVFDVGYSNGEPNRDGNSDKSVIGRAAIETERFTIGVSGKFHDGIGSEEQKYYQNYAGVDAAYRIGRFTLSAEAGYDQHGFHRDVFAENPVPNFGPRSFYGRDVYFGTVDRPVYGYSYYLNLSYELEKWRADLSYGEYHPEQIGQPLHDAKAQRAIFKLSYSPVRQFTTFATVIAENTRPVEQIRQNNSPFAVWTGAQYSF